MNGLMLRDRLYKGLGTSARRIGQDTNAFRPTSPFNPLHPVNRFLRLPAAFISVNGSDRRPNAYGEVLWQGIFDASYTRAGDYLVQEAGIFFVASQIALLPVMCVMTNRTISAARPNAQTIPAGNSYGGYISGSSSLLLSGWPASVLSNNRSGISLAKLPTDQAIPSLDILLPAVQDIMFAPGDMITDDLNRSALVQASELTYLGWRLSANW